jgi:hypothetical protein
MKVSEGLILPGNVGAIVNRMEQTGQPSLSNNHLKTRMATSGQISAQSAQPVHFS